ncbi:hypothetical protein M758_8G005200 [Ceratodon purpureus]|uniref:Uncharacterized protein n=1 Tax=Ceratodon purpureus TaxID=3225 RepID=A0A8T0GX39_CERPU|nr:hypothetical protein KC19_8G005800 [Ceratodon purpureus]KAG0607150.1 hypothetical protein M758_8G005200 [Ceratodon purpureus]
MSLESSSAVQPHSTTISTNSCHILRRVVDTTKTALLVANLQPEKMKRKLSTRNQARKLRRRKRAGVRETSQTTTTLFTTASKRNVAHRAGGARGRGGLASLKSRAATNASNKLEGAGERRGKKQREGGGRERVGEGACSVG